MKSLPPLLRRAISPRPRPRPAAPPSRRDARRPLSAAPSPPADTAFRHDAPWLASSTDSTPAFRNFIGGRWEDPEDGGGAPSIPLRDPSSGLLLSVVPESSPSDVGRAVSAAAAAFPDWSGTPVQVRQRLMLEYAHVLHKKEVREEIA